MQQRRGGSNSTSSPASGSADPLPLPARPANPADPATRIHFQSSFDQIAVGIAHTTIDGRILEVNRKLCDMLGYTADELLRLRTRDITHPDDRDQQDQMRRELLDGARTHFSGEKRYLRKDGSTFWISRTVALAKTPEGGQYLIQTIDDINERKRVEVTLLRLGRARRVMAECTHILIHATQQADMLRNLCRVVVESGGYRQAWIGLKSGNPERPIKPAAHAGYGNDSPMSGTSSRSYTDNHKGVAASAFLSGEPQILRDILNNPRYEGLRTRALQLNYQSTIAMPMTGDSQIIGVLVLHAAENDAFDEEEIRLLTELTSDIGFGITSLNARIAREQAEQRTREHENRFREIFEQAAVGITWVDLDGTLVECNQKFSDMLDYAREELIGRPMKTFTHPDDQGSGALYRAQLVAGSVNTRTHEKRYLRKDGTPVWTRRTMSTACNAEGRPLYVIGIIENITDRKELEQHHRDTFNQAAVGIVHTSDDGRYLRVNRKFCEMMGYDESELLDRKAADFTIPGDRDRDARNRRLMWEGKLGNYAEEKQYLRKNGSILWANRTVSLARDAAGKPLFFIRVIEDITERKEADLRYRSTFDNAPIGIMHTDIDSYRILHVNPKLCEMLGYTEQELLQMHSSDVVHPEFRFIDRDKYLEPILKGEESAYSSERKFLRKNGEVFWVNRTVSLARDTSGKPLHHIRIIEDITKRKLAEDKLNYLASFDTVTTLPNRYVFTDRLGQMLAQAQRNNWSVAVLFVDLDRFKTVNDTFGHAAGDDLLRQAAQRMQDCVRTSDTVARLSGDEFAVMLSNLARTDDAGVVAQKIVESLVAPFSLKGEKAYISASVGIALYPSDGDNPDVLLRNADTAMYRAKSEGRNGYQFYLPQMNERLHHRQQLELQLRGALDRNEFLLHFQPKASLATGAITGFEALLRWQYDGKLVPPSEFIGVLEDTGLIVQVGDWILNAVCAQIKQWQQQGIDPRPVAVNLSARQFQVKNLADAVGRALRQHKVAPELLKLELTESLLMSDAEESVQTLYHLKILGVQLSVDDFGTGYSSLAYLKRFPLDELKIDREFIRDAVSDPDDAAITLTIINLAHSLKLKVVAEGVETEGQLNFLRYHGCDEIQGYYFAKPVTADLCAAMLQGDRRLPPPQSTAISNSIALLLVSENEQGLQLLTQAFSADSFRLLIAKNATDGFEILAQNRIDVVICDNDITSMSGVQFLTRVRKLYANTLRVLASSGDDAPTLTRATNMAGIHLFLPGTWTAERLRSEVRDTLQSYMNAAVSSGPHPVLKSPKD